MTRTNDIEFIASIMIAKIENDSRIIDDAIDEYEFMKLNDAIGQFESRELIISESMIESFIIANSNSNDDAIDKMIALMRKYDSQLNIALQSYLINNNLI